MRAAEPRPSIVAITAEASGLRSLVRVTLGRDDDEAVGFAEGSIATTARHRLVATATVDALRQLEPAAECVDVDHAQIVRIGAHDVAVVTVVFVVPPAEQTRVGFGDRAPAARGRRGRPGGARRDQPPPRVRQRSRSALRRSAMAPQAVTISFRLGGDDGVSVEARKWAAALRELGFETRRVAGADRRRRPDPTTS